MIPADFFEDYPLYRKRVIAKVGLHIVHQVSELAPPIQAECPHCAQQRTFGIERCGSVGLCPYWNRKTQADGGRCSDRMISFEYLCAGCKKYLRIYYVFFDVDSVIKVGQFPPWSVEPAEPLRTALGVHLTNYKKGMTNESISYGIGAFAYYRRVVEDLIVGLLEQIGELIPESEREAFQEAIAAARRESVAEKKIQLVKHLLPESLKIDGINPLEVIYSCLSQGLHVKSDESCLEMADALRHATAHLVEEIERSKMRKANFTDGMRKVLNRNWSQGKAQTGSA